MDQLRRYSLLDCLDEGIPGEALEGIIACCSKGYHPDVLCSRLNSEANCYLLLLLSNGDMLIDNDDRKMRLKANDFLLLSPTVIMKKVEINEHCRAIHLIVASSVFREIELPQANTDVEFSIFPVVYHLSEEKTEEIAGIMQQIEHAIKIPHVFRKDIIKSLLFVCKTIIAEMNLGEYELHDYSHKENIFKIFLHLASTHFKENRQIDFYADHLCITNTYLSRIVKEVSGKTVYSYLSELLYEEACRQLAETQKTMGEISLALNFKDQSAFTNFFKLKSGMSPKGYRERRLSVGH